MTEQEQIVKEINTTIENSLSTQEVWTDYMKELLSKLVIDAMSKAYDKGYDDAYDNQASDRSSKKLRY